MERTKVTESDGRNVKRIGDLKAADFYRYYLGGHSEPAREFTLAVYIRGQERAYMCAPMDYHPDGSITFSGSIPIGVTVQLTEAIPEVIVEDIEAEFKD